MLFVEWLSSSMGTSLGMVISATSTWSKTSNISNCKFTHSTLRRWLCLWHTKDTKNRIRTKEMRTAENKARPSRTSQNGWFDLVLRYGFWPGLRSCEQHNESGPIFIVVAIWLRISNKSIIIDYLLAQSTCRLDGKQISMRPRQANVRSAESSFCRQITHQQQKNGENKKNYNHFDVAVKLLKWTWFNRPHANANVLQVVHRQFANLSLRRHFEALSPRLLVAFAPNQIGPIEFHHKLYTPCWKRSQANPSKHDNW